MLSPVWCGPIPVLSVGSRKLVCWLYSYRCELHGWLVWEWLRVVLELIECTQV